MKFIFVSPFDLVTERLWGPTLRLFMLARELNKLGHTSYLMGPPPFNRPKPSTLNGVPLLFFKHAFYRYPYPDNEKKKIAKEQPSKYLLPILILKRTFQLWRMIGKLKPDFLIVNRANVDTAYPVLLNHLLRGIPLIYDWDDIEGLHGFCSSHRSPLAYQLFYTANETSFGRLANVTVIASKFLQDFCRDIGVSDDRIFYAPTVADTEMFNPGVDGLKIRKRYQLEGKKVLLYLGNLLSGNGVRVENVIHAAAILKKNIPDLRILLLGDGDLVVKEGKDGFLVRLVNELNLGENVIFTGGVPYNQVPDYIAASDLCLALFPVNVITLAKSPLKVYEYMAAGKPVVARAVGECARCIKDGKTGFLVYSDDPIEYARVIGSALENENLLKQVGGSARREVENIFSWKHSARTLLEASARAKDIQKTHSWLTKTKKRPIHSIKD